MTPVFRSDHGFDGGAKSENTRNYYPWRKLDEVVRCAMGEGLPVCPESHWITSHWFGGVSTGTPANDKITHVAPPIAVHGSQEIEVLFWRGADRCPAGLHPNFLETKMRQIAMAAHGVG